jgi:predicted SprT family Zn-dependent metalloprotease
MRQTDQLVQSLVHETLLKLNRTELCRHLEIRWEPRFTRRMGDASYLAKHGVVLTARIRLSPVLWDLATKEEQEETVVHEVCHLVTEHEAMLRGDPHPAAHGTEWAAVMRRAGAKGQRCHNVDRTGIARATARYYLTCQCGKPQVISAARATKIRKGKLYKCLVCHTIVQLGGRVQ